MKQKLSLSAFQPKVKLDIRQVVNYSPKDLFKEDTKSPYIIDYDVKLSNGVSLQRDFVWTMEQKRLLIISLIKEIQIPNFAVVIYRSEDDRNISNFKIIDGKQRLKAIEEFYNNEFGIIVNDEEYFLRDFDQTAAFRFNYASLNFNIIYEYDDTMLSDEQLIGWFDLVNFAGTPQDAEHIAKLRKTLQ